MKNVLSKCVVGSLLVGLASAASAQSLTASQTTATINTSAHATTVQFAPGSTPTNSFNFDLNFDTARLTFASVAVPTGVSCNGVATPGTVRCLADGGDDGANLLALPALTITIRFDVGGTVGVTPLTLANVVMTDTTGNGQMPTVTSGQVDVNAAPPNTNLSYNPTAGSTISFPTGTALTTQNSSITVTGTGTVGSGTVTNCGITGPGAGVFGPAPGDLTVNGGSTGTLNLSCTLPNSGGAATATLTCTETDADTPAPGAARTWNLSCPQGTPVPGPGYSSTPAPGANISCNGQPGTVVQTNIVITNNGNPGAGSGLDFSCSTSGAPFSIVSGGSATGLAVGASQTVVVGCTAPAEGAPAATGTASCTTNAPGGARSYNLSTIGLTVPPPVPRPAIVPASSTWSQIALIALLAGLGLAVVGFRRNH